MGPHGHIRNYYIASFPEPLTALVSCSATGAGLVRYSTTSTARLLQKMTQYYTETPRIAWVEGIQVRREGQGDLWGRVEGIQGRVEGIQGRVEGQ